MPLSRRGGAAHPRRTRGGRTRSPPFAQLIRDVGLEIEPGVTFLLGENGSGKSTLLEAIASGSDRRGHETPFVSVTGPSKSREDSPLGYHLALEYGRGASPAGFFLRESFLAVLKPLLVSLPVATLQLDDEGIKRVASYDDLALVQDWRHFLTTPGRFLNTSSARAKTTANTETA